MNHRLFSGCILFALLFLAGCKKETTEPTPQPLPVTAKLSRTMAYQNSSTRFTAEYENDAFRHAASQSAEKLQFGFWTTYPAGSDGLSFSIPKARQKTGLVGTYTLATLPNPALGEAAVDYRFATGENCTVIFQSGTTLVEGSLVITAYDPKRKTLSGTYTVRLPGAYDPFDPSFLPEKRVNFTISGSFANLPVKDE